MKGNVKNTEEYLATLPDWQKKNLEIFRQAIHAVIPDVKEEIKWGVPVFICNAKILFAMSSFKAHTKYNFIHNGALINDPAKLFNNGFESKKSRAIDLRQGEKADIRELKKLIVDCTKIKSK
jgi:hypothetical protein